MTIHLHLEPAAFRAAVLETCRANNHEDGYIRVSISRGVGLGLDPRVNAVAALTILVVSIGVVVASLLMARAERRRQKQVAAAFKG